MDINMLLKHKVLKKLCIINRLRTVGLLLKFQEFILTIFTGIFHEFEYPIVRFKKSIDLIKNFKVFFTSCLT